MAFFRSPLKQIFVTPLSMKSLTLSTLSQTHCWPSTANFFISMKSLSQTPCFSSTANLLINSLGLSPDSAFKAAQAIRWEPIATSDAIIAIFKSYGFSASQIVRIFTRNPQVLRSNTKKNIEPKLAFLSESGIQSENLIRIICQDPRVLRRSLHFTIMPCIRLLKTFFGNCDDDIVSHLSLRGGTNVLNDFSEAMEPNMETLRKHGVPHENIQRILSLRPRILRLDVHKFSEIVREAKEMMGLDASGMRFIETIGTLSLKADDKWLSKVEVFKSLGWSDEQVGSLITKRRKLLTKIMHLSEQTLRRKLDQLSNNLNWGPRQVLKIPAIILLSAENRVLPRYNVLQKLISMHLFDKKKINSATFIMSEDKFLNRYVRCYLQDIPELLDLYQKSKLNSRN